MFRPALVAALLLLSACQAAAPAPPQPAIVPLNYLPALAGGYFPITSAETGTTYHIYIRLPDGYAANPAKKYPIVYLLDGDSVFPLLAPTHLFLTYDDGLPEAIIVGIAYGGFDPAINKRDIDFSAVSDNPDRPAGAPKFHRFLERELLPKVEGQYRADVERRILVGQSRGGYFIFYSAFANPDLFWGRIASNAGMRPGEEKFIEKAAPHNRADLTLIYSSGTNDRDPGRKTALYWFDQWKSKSASRPWKFTPIEIKNGTHAADIGQVYRRAMAILFAQDKIE